MINKILVISILLFAFNSCQTNVSVPMEELEQSTIAAIGDSITYGQRIIRRSENSYPSQLNTILGTSWLVGNFGLNGATLLKKGNVPYMSSIAFRKAISFNPQIVIIALGTNDSKPINWKNKKDFVENYLELINKFKQLDSEPHIFICYPVPAYSRLWGINNQIIIDEIIPMIDEVSRLAAVEIIDLYSPFEGKSNLFPDTVHPNGEGATLIALTINNFLESKELRTD